jgi:hypothetical protein
MRREEQRMEERWSTSAEHWRRGEEEEYLGMSLGSRVLYVGSAGVGALLRCSLQHNFENK